MRAKRYEYYEKVNRQGAFDNKVYRCYWSRITGKKRVQYWAPSCRRWFISGTYSSLHNEPVMKLIDREKAIKIVPYLKDRI